MILAVRVVVYALCVLGASSAQGANSSSSAALIDAMVERLGYMRDVAAWKWREKAPIEDLSRERLVLENAVQEAKRVGLDADSTRGFFRQQIEASKDIQRSWHARWRDGESPPIRTRDLATELRVAISKVSRDITRLLAIESPDLSPEIPDRLQREGQSLGLARQRIGALYDAALAVKYADVNEASEATLIDHVRARSVLRVGTTGDYRPFSYRGEDSALRGIDIEMAKLLAASLEVNVRWVITSWPTLSDDLVRRRYDIAMSGVSRNLSRQRDGLFSIPYHEGGKTPVARCDRAAQYGRLDTIDRPGVRVIVNPGGTNEQFVREHIERAKIIVHADNITIFRQLVSDRADVMITDAIEVRLQTSLNPALCATMPGRTLTYSVKAYWMPRDPVFLEHVNAVVREARGDGTLDAIFSRYLPVHRERAAPAHR